MTLDVLSLLDAHKGQGHDLYAQYVNPQFVNVLRTIGFDKRYVRAEGPYLYDDEGQEYLDMLSGYGVFNMGRNHPKVREVLHAALEAELPSMIQMDAPLLAGLLAQKLLSKVGGTTDMVFFTNSGTEAVEGAIKFARKATGRSRLLYFDHAFHGLTNGSLSVNGNAEFRNGFGELLPATKIALGDAAQLRAELARGDVAALILEPVQGKGVYTASAEFYAEAQTLCREYGALLIADEVQSGMGRTGKWFAHQHWNLQPDIVAIAKALSGGYVPVGAVCYRREIYDRVFRSMDECVVHSNTFGRNALAMVAGLAAIDVIDEEHLIANAAARGTQLMDGVRAMASRFEMIGEVRGIGLMNGIEFREPRSLALRAGWKLVHSVNSGLFGQMVVVPLMSEHRILTQVAGHSVDIVKLLPPLVITEQQVQYFLEAFASVMASCHRFPGSVWSVGKQLAVAAAKVSMTKRAPVGESAITNG